MQALGYSILAPASIPGLHWNSVHRKSTIIFCWQTFIVKAKQGRRGSLHTERTLARFLQSVRFQMIRENVSENKNCEVRREVNRARVIAQNSFRPLTGTDR